MKLMKIIAQLLLGCLFWLLATYWAIFALYTITSLLRGGPGSVIAWYSHIAGMQFHWNWKRFLADQTALLATTVAVYFLRRWVRARHT
jgi:hypothetical protein